MHPRMCAAWWVAAGGTERGMRVVADARCRAWCAARRGRAGLVCIRQTAEAYRAPRPHDRSDQCRAHVAADGTRVMLRASRERVLLLCVAQRRKQRSRPEPLEQPDVAARRTTERAVIPQLGASPPPHPQACLILTRSARPRLAAHHARHRASTTTRPVPRLPPHHHAQIHSGCLTATLRATTRLPLPGRDPPSRPAEASGRTPSWPPPYASSCRPPPPSSSHPPPPSARRPSCSAAPFPYTPLPGLLDSAVRPPARSREPKTCSPPS